MFIYSLILRLVAFCLSLLMKYIFINMLGSQENQQTSTLILPSLHMSRSNESNYTDVMKLIHLKKWQYRSELSKDSVNHVDKSLRYVRSQSNTNATVEMSTLGREAFKQQMLARGSSSQLADYSQSPINRKLFKVQLSRIDQQNDSLPAKKEQKVKEWKSASRNARYKTQSDMPSDKKRLKKVEFSKLGSKKQGKNLLKEHFLDVIGQIKSEGKDDKKLEVLARTLETFNPFFIKLNRTISVCLLKVGKIIERPSNRVLYEIGTRYNYFYIILSGKVKLKGHDDMHKLCQEGETILEETLLAKRREQAYSYERAKTVTTTHLLQVDREEMAKLRAQLIHYGFTQGANELDTIIKRNNIIKSWVRNKYKLISKNS